MNQALVRNRRICNCIKTKKNVYTWTLPQSYYYLPSWMSFLKNFISVWNFCVEFLRKTPFVWCVQVRIQAKFHEAYGENRFTKFWSIGKIHKTSRSAACWSILSWNINYCMLAVLLELQQWDNKGSFQAGAMLIYWLMGACTEGRSYRW